MPPLNELITTALGNNAALGLSDILVNAITEDSRKVLPGTIFVAIKGAKSNGEDFIDKAVENGAVAIIAAQKMDASVPVIVHANPRLALSKLASMLYPGQPETAVAVTGTNGKTSTVHFCRELWAAMGKNAASIGTIGVMGADGKPIIETSASMTSPDPVFFHQLLQQLKNKNITHLAFEASSHGLDQHRIDGANIRAAGFTSFSRDHMDYHETMEEYFLAKQKLFTDVLSPDGIAVINADMEVSQKLFDACVQKNIRVMSYGKNIFEKQADAKNNSIKILARAALPAGQHARLEIQGQSHEITLPLVGEFQLYNVLCAIGLLIACGEKIEKIIPHVKNLAPVPGRMQQAAMHDCNGAVYIDYAHTPDALEKALLALKPHVHNKLVVVFGCGGNRDKGKRPLMGQIAASIADRVVITDDNPRHEDPSVIRAEILSGAPGSEVVADRREAIRHAMSKMQSGDVLLVAGKGHEPYQIIGDTSYPFDDAIEAAILAKDLWEK